MLRGLIYVSATVALLTSVSSAQVCSCAGAPLLGSLDDAATPIVVAGSVERNFLAAFQRPLGKNNELLELTSVSDSSSAVMMDEEGTRWDVFGTALNGYREGSTLQRTDQAYMAYWFAWAAFNPATHLRTAQQNVPIRYAS